MGISGRYSHLTPTAWTILGFLAFCPRNGYQLRQAVQRSVGHFWGVSYGQLYPQLKYLSEANLIEPDGDAEPTVKQGESTGKQQVWRLTHDGGRALREWLTAPAEPASRRDEGLVKLLFSDHAGIAVTREMIARRRAECQDRKTRVERIVPGAHWAPDANRKPENLLAAHLVRSHAIAMADAELSWCDLADVLIDQREAEAYVH